MSTLQRPHALLLVATLASFAHGCSVSETELIDGGALDAQIHEAKPDAESEAAKPHAYRDGGPVGNRGAHDAELPGPTLDASLEPDGSPGEPDAAGTHVALDAAVEIAADASAGGSAAQSGCDGQGEGAVERRTRYAAPYVIAGYRCVSAVQARTCSNGAWTEWEGDLDGDGTGFAHDTCVTRLDECLPGYESACSPLHAACAEHEGKFACQCEEHYVGDGHQCEPDECALGTDRCSVLADCINLVGEWVQGLGYTCECRDGFAPIGASPPTCSRMPSREWDPGFGTGWPEDGDAAIDSEGSVYLSSASYQNQLGGAPVLGSFLAKYAKNGAQQWLRRYDDPITGLRVDASDHVITASYREEGSHPDEPAAGWVLRELDPDGDVLWEQLYPWGSTLGLAVDPSGRIYVGGHNWVAHIERGGAVAWHKGFNSPSAVYGRGVVASNNRVFLLAEINDVAWLGANRPVGKEHTAAGLVLAFSPEGAQLGHEVLPAYLASGVVTGDDTLVVSLIHAIPGQLMRRELKAVMSSSSLSYDVGSQVGRLRGHADGSVTFATAVDAIFDGSVSGVGIGRVTPNGTLLFAHYPQNTARAHQLLLDEQGRDVVVWGTPVDGPYPVRFRYQLTWLEPAAAR